MVGQALGLAIPRVMLWHMRLHSSAQFQGAALPPAREAAASGQDSQAAPQQAP